ncbi:MAG: methyltransferase domain-containing protein [Chloroflexota bacterium]|nr:methyltransferase domain-containing protein [Chloroflexota bacterium]
MEIKSNPAQPYATHPDYTVRMLAMWELPRRTLMRQAIEALQLPDGSRGLDAGCGIGLQALMLTEAVGPNGHVTGIDIASKQLAIAEEIAASNGMSQRVKFVEASINRLPFEDDSFDWAWSADCVGYSSGDHVHRIREMARVVKPGGTVAILYYSSQQLLPGYPGLEARLNATASGIAPFVHGMKPETHFTRALGWFRAAGLDRLAAQTFVGDTHAPLSDEMREALATLIEMRWPNVESELPQDDRDLFHRLCKPDSPDFILDISDYYAFFTYSMFHGTASK